MLIPKNTQTIVVKDSTFACFQWMQIAQKKLWLRIFFEIIRFSNGQPDITMKPYLST